MKFLKMRLNESIKIGIKLCRQVLYPLLLLFVNVIMYTYNGAELVSSFSMFWTGIIVTFGYQFILNRQSEKNE